MSILQAILLGVLYWIGEANLPFVGLWTVQRPLVCGWIAGLILGDPLKGAMVGASINLVYLGSFPNKRILRNNLCLPACKEKNIAIKPEYYINVLVALLR